MKHVPVLLKEVLEIFDPQPGKRYVDCTINGGGHTKEILNRVGTAGMILGIDWDSARIQELEKEKKETNSRNLILVCDNYANLQLIVAKYHFGPIAGVLFDCGVSSLQLAEKGRGFSFLRNDRLDMRYDLVGNPLTAEKIVNEWDEKSLRHVLETFGEERFAKRIVLGIVKERKKKRITTAKELASLITASVPHWSRSTKIHPATRTFQALRIAVNHELENLEAGLVAGIKVLAPGGKMVVISFHSLEDRIVKNFFKNTEYNRTASRLFQKPIVPSMQERTENPRSRSAKLRAAMKI